MNLFNRMGLSAPTHHDKPSADSVAYRKIDSRRDVCVDELQHVDDGVAIYGAATHDDVRQMQRRAQELNAFSTIHISEIHVEASYNGPKRYLPDFDHLQLQLRELTYSDKVWTMEQPADRVGWDLIKAIGPQTVGKVTS